MKKRWISLLLVLLMVVSLLPMSAFAAKDANGAFNYLKSYLITNGKYSNGNYIAVLHVTDDGAVCASYDSDDGTITAGTISDTGTLEIATLFEMDPNLSMPYISITTVEANGSVVMSAWANIYSSFTEDSYLSLYNTKGVSDTTSLRKLITTSVALTIAVLQNYVFKGSSYTVGDLGFTAFAEKHGLSPAAQSGWQQIGGKWYYYQNGSAVTGWQKINNVWYFFNNSGVMQTGWQKIGGAWYYFQSGGQMVVGWQKIGNVWYYFQSGGQMVTGWRDINGKTYYFKPSGAMAASEWCNGWWLNADGSWTYPYKGSWKQNSTGWWFGDTSGWYAKNETIRINDVYYTFNAAGYMV